ncbi:hypothetical protein [Bdellovibrio sp. HCB337]|uniref:hypothetical protein n=1 Tax=Bdellovibrio sp. HCB337 TaxID=3394358 RepID=UPI0039A58219
MKLFNNFLLFAIKSALIVGLLSCLAVAVSLLIKQESLLSLGFIYVVAYGAAFGFVAGAIGFWVMWYFRTLSLAKFKMVSYIVAVVLGVATLAFFYGGRLFGVDSVLDFVVFPLFPFCVSVFLFTKIAQKHLRSPL